MLGYFSRPAPAPVPPPPAGVPSGQVSIGSPQSYGPDKEMFEKCAGVSAKAGLKCAAITHLGEKRRGVGMRKIPGKSGRILGGDDTEKKKTISHLLSVSLSARGENVVKAFRHCSEITAPFVAENRSRLERQLYAQTLFCQQADTQ
jgi:hypothetical protein